MEEKVFAISESLTGEEIKGVRNRLKLTQKEFADLVNVSVKTVERWETGNRPVVGPVVALAKVLMDYPQFSEQYRIPEKTYPMRLWYMCGSQICSVIDVAEQRKMVKVFNFIRHDQYRAFGRVEMPTFEEYEEFLESRCFPRSRDKMKLMLRELDLPFYDPLLIVEKTGGRMAEDDFWIRIER